VWNYESDTAGNITKLAPQIRGGITAGQTYSLALDRQKRRFAYHSMMIAANAFTRMRALVRR